LVVVVVKGCILNIPDPITAITLVAVGTSVPDTFASMIAAKNEPNADAALTNVTGSNAVNIFLGLGSRLVYTYETSVYI
jgi:solute carrier family 8 (sodium/calcium exchanger)